MPTFTHGSKAVLKVQDAGNTSRDISNVTSSVDFEREADTAEVTSLGNTSKAYIGGLKDGNVSFDYNRDVTVEGYLDGILGIERAMEYHPEGVVSGKRKYSFQGILTSISETSDVDDSNKGQCKVQITGDVTAGVNP